jgi:hypothetical protein
MAVSSFSFHYNDRQELTKFGIWKNSLPHRLRNWYEHFTYLWGTVYSHFFYCSYIPIIVRNGIFLSKYIYYFFTRTPLFTEEWVFKF